jgi:hypothetical protein
LYPPVPPSLLQKLPPHLIPPSTQRAKDITSKENGKGKKTPFISSAMPTTPSHLIVLQFPPNPHPTIRSGSSRRVDRGGHRCKKSFRPTAARYVLRIRHVRLEIETSRKHVVFVRTVSLVGYRCRRQGNSLNPGTVCRGLPAAQALESVQGVSSRWVVSAPTSSAYGTIRITSLSLRRPPKGRRGPG